YPACRSTRSHARGDEVVERTKQYRRARAEKKESKKNKRVRDADRCFGVWDVKRPPACDDHQRGQHRKPKPTVKRESSKPDQRPDDNPASHGVAHPPVHPGVEVEVINTQRRGFHVPTRSPFFYSIEPDLRILTVRLRESGRPYPC